AVGTDMPAVADSRREAAAAIGVLEEWVPAGHAVDQPVLDPRHDALERAQLIRLERGGLGRLRLLDDRLPGVAFCRLRLSDRRDRQQTDERKCGWESFEP